MEHNKELFGLGVAFEPYAHNPENHYFMPYFCRNGAELKLQWLGSDSYRYFYQDWYQIPRELERPIWSEPYFDEGAGNIIMSTFSVPFYQETEGRRKLAGIVGADISLMWLEDIVSTVKIYQTGYAFLISQNGVFVTHPKKRWIMRESMFSLAEASYNPTLREVGREMIRGGEGFVPIYSEVLGKKSWLYYAPLPSTGWSLGVIIPEDELFADAQRLMQRTVGIAVLGLILLAVVITVISRSGSPGPCGSWPGRPRTSPTATSPPPCRKPGPGRSPIWPAPLTAWAGNSPITWPSGTSSGTPSGATSPRKW